MDWAGPPKSGLCSVTLLGMGGGGVSGAAGTKEAQKDRPFLPGQSRRIVGCKQVLLLHICKPTEILIWSLRCHLPHQKPDPRATTRGSVHRHGPQSSSCARWYTSWSRIEQAMLCWKVGAQVTICYAARQA